MKIKSDFVTNSSSSSFIVGWDPDTFSDLEDYIHKLNEHEDAGNEGVRYYESFRTMKELDEYTNDGPFDWASLPCGVRFENLNEESYEICKSMLKEYGSATIVMVDYNVCEIFEDDMGDKAKYNPSY